MARRSSSCPPWLGRSDWMVAPDVQDLFDSWAVDDIHCEVPLGPVGWICFCCYVWLELPWYSILRGRLGPPCPECWHHGLLVRLEPVGWVPALAGCELISKVAVFGDSSYFLLFFDVVVAMLSESVLRESVQRSVCVSGHVVACDTAACPVAAFLLFFDVVVAFLFHSCCL